MSSARIVEPVDVFEDRQFCGVVPCFQVPGRTGLVQSSLAPVCHHYVNNRNNRARSKSAGNLSTTFTIGCHPASDKEFR